jgi:polysaccharide deacetylase 2 family uncharacterized protein YibQ
MKSLAVAAGIVFWTLVLGVAVLVFFPGGNSGEPVALLHVEPAPETAAAGASSEGTAASPQTTTGGTVDLPPGFSVTGPARPQAPMLAPPGQGTTMMPVAPAEPPPGPQGSLSPGAQGRASEASADATTQPPQVPAAPSHGSAQPAAQQAAAVADGSEETGSIAMASAPVPDLVEQSQYGPLPKIAADGRRPMEVYARPSRFAAGAGGPARVAVLVTGLGVPSGPEGDVIKGLPPPVSIAFGAYGHSLQEWVTKARAEGHEVLLAIPLEPNDYPTEDPGPHTLLTTLPTEENMKRLHWLMSRYTGYVGVTNDMGAKFEATQASFQPVLEDLKHRGLFYLEDGSIENSIAGQIARALGLEYSVAQVQLDAGNMPKAFAKLEAGAKEQGAAIGVAKAEPETVKEITKWAAKLERKGLVLVPVSAAVRSQRQS